MNLTRDFAEYLQDNLFAVFGTDLFIGGVPDNAPSSSWWIVSAGGTPVIKNETNEKIKSYIINVFYRDTNGETVYDLLQLLEEQINSDPCPELSNYEVVEFEATLFGTDQDLDVQDRTVGLLQATLTIHA